MGIIHLHKCQPPLKTLNNPPTPTSSAPSMDTRSSPRRPSTPFLPLSTWSLAPPHPHVLRPSYVGAKAIGDLNKAFKYFYQYFTLSLPGSMGYLIAAAFYILRYAGYGSYMCEAFGYGYYVIYYANYANELLTMLSDQAASS